jgi:hypothetical protein
MNHASGTVTALDTEVIQVGDSIWQRGIRRPFGRLVLILLAAA